MADMPEVEKEDDDENEDAKEKEDSMYDWQAEDDMRTLARAEEIKRDPKRLEAAQMKARERLKELRAVAAAGPKSKR